MAYQLRKKERVNYRNAADIQLPRARRSTKNDKFYELEIIEEDEYTGWVKKVHYIGYGTECNEWREKSDIVVTKHQEDTYVPFHLHNELAYQIKLALNSSSRSDPEVRIEIPFDHFLFKGGLQQAGRLVKKDRGHEVYRIETYSSLVHILGVNWHLRVRNKEYDFCYVILETVKYYLHRRQPIVDSYEPLHSVDGGYVLVFRFVRGDGVRRHWDDVVQIA